ncbi:DUF6776 family protein [Ramlibacter algicola]|uniref:Uncharacterized protein n=1 Tax=Ramlibacter algicola TaxID=2795217 RepID=A0A934Q4I3_9BURK|nr:DUF6776 family protein [Ramlibacter algicola]MBK0394758.1 hypothetical protein [Ramlibacter algicola]
MRWKLLRRRLTISAPRMKVRTAMPWPLRWAVIAIVLGFCGAISLWAFELGKSLAGLDTRAKEELVQLRSEVERLRDERDKVQSVLNTSGSLLTTERAAQSRLTAQVRQLEAENRGLRDDLAFFEKLMPVNANEAVAIRALQAEMLAGSQLKWQVLVIQHARNAPEFRGKLLLSLGGTLDGKPWSMDLPDGARDLRFRQYGRLEGMVDLPSQAVVKNVSARVVDGTSTRAVQSIQLGT